jgi:hypothetical protein
MLTEARQGRLDELRRREFAGTLTGDEHAELEVFFAELDAEEAEALRPAMERMDWELRELQAEKKLRESEIAALQRIAREKEQLLAEARAYAAKLRAKSTALDEEFRRVARREVAVATRKRT